MLGSNVETLVKLINDILIETDTQRIFKHTYPIRTDLDDNGIYGSTGTDGGDYAHSHDAGSLAVPSSATETKSFGTINNILDVKSKGVIYQELMRKIDIIERNIYVPSNQMNNSIGSPYQELFRLRDSIQTAINFSEKYQYLCEYVYNSIQAIHIIHCVRTNAIDAKWAVITYADHLERGYNYVQNQDPETTK